MFSIQKTDRFSVAQIGARMHYAVPRILESGGRLEMLFTDISIDHGMSRAVKFAPSFLKNKFLSKLRGRLVSGVPLEKIVAFEYIGYIYTLKLQMARNEADRLRAFIWVEEQFSKKIRTFGFGGSKSVYAFNGAALHLFESAAKDGVTKILEQTIAPKRIENELLGASGFLDARAIAFLDSPVMREFVEKEEAEWKAADTILCASDFVMDGLISCGVSRAKCHVVPYGVNLSPYVDKGNSRSASGKTVNVLFVGGVGSRKGIWSLLEAMRSLSRLDVKCRVVGPIAADLKQLSRECPANTEIVGSVARSEIPGEFERADIFCLPSLCEGSATVIYEALAAGLPVITTANSGSIVRDGIEGLIIPHSNSDALAEAVVRLVTDSDFRLETGRNALTRSRYGSLSAYSERLLSVLSESSSC